MIKSGEPPLRLTQATSPIRRPAESSACRNGVLKVYYTAQSFERLQRRILLFSFAEFNYPNHRGICYLSTILCFALLVFGQAPAFSIRASLNLAPPRPTSSPPGSQMRGNCGAHKLTRRVPEWLALYPSSQTWLSYINCRYWSS